MIRWRRVLIERALPKQPDRIKRRLEPKLDHCGAQLTKAARTGWIMQRRSGR